MLCVCKVAVLCAWRGCVCVCYGKENPSKEAGLSDLCPHFPSHQRHGHVRPDAPCDCHWHAGPTALWCHQHVYPGPQQSGSDRTLRNTLASGLLIQGIRRGYHGWGSQVSALCFLIWKTHLGCVCGCEGLCVFPCAISVFMCSVFLGDCIFHSLCRARGGCSLNLGITLLLYNNWPHSNMLIVWKTSWACF